MSEVKIRKKDIQEARRPDKVLVGATTAFDWIVENRKLLLGALAAVIVIGLVGSVVTSSARERNREVGAKLSSALELATRDVVEGQTTGGADGTEKVFPSLAEKQKAVREALESVRAEASGSEAALAAQLRLARLDVEEGKADDAIAKYEDYLSKVKQGGLRLFALEGLGYAWEAKGDLTKAGEAFGQLGEAGAPARALFHKARLAEKGGNKDEARKLYEQVVSDYEKEIVASEARTRLELLNAPPPGQGAFEKAEAATPAADSTAKQARK